MTLARIVSLRGSPRAFLKEEFDELGAALSGASFLGQTAVTASPSITP